MQGVWAFLLLGWVVVSSTNFNFNDRGFNESQW
jgi:hypothetical protein